MAAGETLAADILAVQKARRYQRLKRWLDVVISAALLVILSPLLAVLALAVKLHSPGPIIFRQTRLGKDGKPFTCLKFRSMRHGADSFIHERYAVSLIKHHDVGPTEGKSLKLERDPRITGLGRILRKLSLDELPQLVNVLKGEMSLVGPRPPLPYEVDAYLEWHHRRFDALPGITGWWQVKGRNRVSFDEMVEMDIYYIEHMSLGLDLKILAMTPWSALHGNGAG